MNLPRPRFGLRQLLALVACSAVVMWGVEKLWPVCREYWARHTLLTAVRGPFVEARPIGAPPQQSQRIPNEYRIQHAVDSVNVLQAGPRLVPALVDVLANGESSARLHAAIAIGKLGQDARSAVPALIRALEDDPDIALRAAYALGQIGDSTGSALGFLAALFSDQQAASAQRMQAGQTLVEIGQTSSLFELMDDEFSTCLGLQVIYDTYQRPRAAADVQAVVAVVVNVLEKSRSALNRQFAADILGFIGPNAAEARDVLKEAASQDESQEVRRAAAAALTRVEVTAAQR